MRVFMNNILIKRIHLLYCCLLSTFGICNGVSDNIKTFYKNASSGKAVEFELCRKVVVDVLQDICGLMDNRNSSNINGCIVNVGSDEDCPLTAEEEIDGMISGNIKILQNICAVLDRAKKGSSNDNTTKLKSQLSTIFINYSENNSSNFQASCQNVLQQWK